MKNVLLTRICAPLVLPGLILYSCTQESKTAGDFTRRPAIDRVIANDVPFSDFTVNADDGDTIDLPEGTRIYIPKGIFTDADGKAVTGNVQIHYRAFYTPGQVIASGITMLYDTANEQQTFSTAGMFEIEGSQNDQPITIAKGKNITMDFASSRDDADYNFYSLDTATGKWSFESVTKAEPNKLRADLEEVINAMMPKPAQPHEFAADDPVINFDINTSDHPELASYSDILWQYAGTGTDPEKNPWIYDHSWTSITLTVKDSSTCKYSLELKDKSDASKTFTTDIFPAMKGENYKKAMKTFNAEMTTYLASEKLRKEKSAQMEEVKPFQRPLNLPWFGIHNCDVWRLVDFVRTVTSRFHFDNPEFTKHLENVVVYVITAAGKIISTYFGTQVPEISYSVSKSTCMVAVLRDSGKTCILKTNEFNACLPPSGTGFAQFNLHACDQIVRDSKDLDALIAGL